MSDQCWFYQIGGDGGDEWHAAASTGYGAPLGLCGFQPETGFARRWQSLVLGETVMPPGHTDGPTRVCQECGDLVTVRSEYKIESAEWRIISPERLAWLEAAVDCCRGNFDCIGHHITTPEPME